MIRTAWVIFEKDWRSEWRTRAGLNTSLLFAVAAPIALSFNLARQQVSPESLAGLLWTILLFAALIGLGRAFVKEEESGTATLLRLYFPSDAVLWGKTLFNFSLLLLTQIAAVPIFLLLLHARVESPLLWVLALLAGDIGLAVACTLLGAVAAQARARGALFAAISIPILLPLLMAASTATAGAMSAQAAADYGAAMQIMIGYDIALLAAAWMLFDYVWSA